MKTQNNLEIKIKEISERLNERHASVPVSQDKADAIYLMKIVEIQSAQIEMYTKHLSATRELLALMITQDIKKEKEINS